jgi:hypothetical protein
MRLRLRFIGAHAILAQRFVDVLNLTPEVCIFGVPLLDNLTMPVKGLWMTISVIYPLTVKGSTATHPNSATNTPFRLAAFFVANKNP